jgi:hypothetical protein
LYLICIMNFFCRLTSFSNTLLYLSSVPDRTLGGVSLLRVKIMQWCKMVKLLKFIFCVGGCIYRGREKPQLCPTITRPLFRWSGVFGGYSESHDPSRRRVGLSLAPLPLTVSDTRVSCVMLSWGGERGSRDNHVRMPGAASWAWLQADWIKVNWDLYQLGLNYFIRYNN